MSGRTASSTPKVNAVGSQVERALQRRDSRQAKATVTTPSGKPVVVDAHIASRVRPDARSTRSTRSSQVYVYHSFGSWHPHPYRDDPYDPMLTGFLLGRLSQPSYYEPTRNWIYYNYDSIDPVRREELFSENVRLRADVERMRRERASVHNASLAGMDPDLVYNDQAASVLYQSQSHVSGWMVLKWLVLVTLVIALFASIGYGLTYKSATLEKWARN